MNRRECSQSSRLEQGIDLGRAALPQGFRSPITGTSFPIERLPQYVEESLETIGVRFAKDIEILRNVLTIKAPVGCLLEEVAAVSGVPGIEINSALCRVCDAWIEVAPNHDVAARLPIAHVTGRLVDLWVSHRDAHLSEAERRSVPSNVPIREGFVKNDMTARALFDAISRLSAPAMLAAGAISQEKVERSGQITKIGQNPFKVFFDTLFVFDPEKANVEKSTADQFIPYLWARLEARWLESARRRCEDGAVRSFKGREGEFTDVASMVEDKTARNFTTSVDQRDEFEWARAALDHALSEGAIRPGDYKAVLQYFGLGDVDVEGGRMGSLAVSIKMRAQRGIEHFKRYLRARGNEPIQPEILLCETQADERISSNHHPTRKSHHQALLRRVERRKEYEYRSR